MIRVQDISRFVFKIFQDLFSRYFKICVGLDLIDASNVRLRPIANIIEVLKWIIRTVLQSIVDQIVDRIVDQAFAPISLGLTTSLYGDL